MAINDPRDISGLVLWYSAEAETGYSDGAALTQWTDLSGNGNHATPASGLAPLFSSSMGPGSGPAISFASGKYFDLPDNLMGSATAGTMAVGVRAANGSSGAWNISTSTNVAHFIYSGWIYDNLGSNNQHAVSAASSLTWYRYQSRTKSGEFKAWLDGSNVYTYGSNTVSWPTTTYFLGKSNDTWPLNGHLTTFILYNRDLTDTEIADLDAWQVANPNGGDLGPPTVNFSGAGTLTTSAVVGVSGTTALAGEGTLVCVVDNSYEGSVALSGAGTLTLTGSPNPRGTLGLSGAGTQTLVGVQGFDGTVTLGGEGTLTAPASGFTGSGSVALAGRGTLAPIGGLDALNVTPALSATQTHDDPIGWFRIFATPPGGDTVELTMFRGVPTTVTSLSTKDPFGEDIASLAFPQITVWDQLGTGDLAWFVDGANIDIIWHNSGAESYSYSWEGFLVDESVTLGEGESGTTVECKGALYQLDNYLAKPTYPQQPIPYERLLFDAFDPEQHPGSAVEPMRIEWPAGWNQVVPDFQDVSNRQWFRRPWGVVPGQKWTGLTSRNTGIWEPTLTAYVQTMLSVMFTEGGGQWTIRNDRGRIPVLYLRTPATATDTDLIVIEPGAPGVSLQMSKDHTQSANVIYGRGQDVAGSQFTGMEVSLDGRKTIYEPFAFDPAVYPDVSNPLFDPNTPRREVQIEFPSGMDAIAGEQVAKAQYKRFADPGYTGEITLKSDPKQQDGTVVPRFLIKAGRSFLIKGFRGVDLIVHSSSVDVDLEGGEVRIAVDSKYRDALTVAEVRERTRDALTPIRLISPGSFSTRTEDMLLPWSYTEGSGILPTAANRMFYRSRTDVAFPWEPITTAFPPKDYPHFYVEIKNPDRLTNANRNWVRWNGAKKDGAVPVRFAQQGTIRLSQIAAYDKHGNVLPVRFHVSIYNNSGVDWTHMPIIPQKPGGGLLKPMLAPTGHSFNAGQHNPFFKDAFEEIKPSGAVQDELGYTYHQTAGFQMGWGNYYEPAGYSPGLASRGAPKTGMLHDEQAWRFDTTQDPNFDPGDPNMRPWKHGVGMLYVLIYCDDRTVDYTGPVYFLGRFFRQEPGGM